jgi:hypothetical protein
MRFLKLLTLATIPLLATPALAQDVQLKDLTVEQASVAQVGMPRPGSLRMSLAANRPDWTYSIGENVGLLLTTNEDAYVTVLRRLSPSGVGSVRGGRLGCFRSACGTARLPPSTRRIASTVSARRCRCLSNGGVKASSQ